MEDFRFLRSTSTGAGSSNNNEDNTILNTLFSGNMPLQHSPVSTTATGGQGSATTSPVATNAPLGTASALHGTPHQRPPPPQPHGLSPGIRASMATSTAQSVPPTIVTCTGTVTKISSLQASAVTSTAPINVTAGTTTASLTTANVSALQTQLQQQQMQQQQMQQQQIQQQQMQQQFQQQLLQQPLQPGPGLASAIASNPHHVSSTLQQIPTHTGQPGAAGVQAVGAAGLHVPGAGGLHVPGAGGLHVAAPPPPAARPQQPIYNVSPFGQVYNQWTPTLRSENEIRAGGEIINWFMHRPSTELEMLLTKQQLIQSGLAYPLIHDDVRTRLIYELNHITSNQWQSAVTSFANVLQDRSVLANKKDSSILHNNVKIIVEFPTMGNNPFSGSSIKILQTALQKRRLNGSGTDPLDYSPILQALKRVIEQFGLSESAAYLISKEVFGGQLGLFLDSCSASGMPYSTFWTSIQGTLASTRSPAAILAMLARIKASKPQNLMETLNSIFQLTRLHCAITHMTNEETFRATRSSFFEVLSSHYPEYCALVKQEDSLNMQLLKRECERLVRLGQDPMGGLTVYHPVLGLQQCCLFIIGTECQRGGPIQQGRRDLGGYQHPRQTGQDRKSVV